MGWMQKNSVWCAEDGWSAPAAAGNTAQATAFLARASLTGSDATNYATLINNLVNDGIGTWAALDALYILAAPTSTVAKLNLVQNAFNCTYHGMPAESLQFLQYRGYTGDGGGAATVYLDTGFSPSTQSTLGGKAQVTDMSLSVYDLSPRTNNFINSKEIGANTSGFSSFAYIDTFLNGANQGFALNDPNGYAPAIVTALPGAQGFWGVSRTSGAPTTLTPYLNGAAQTPSTGNSTTAIVSFNIFILAWNVTGSPSNFSADQLASAHIGGGLSSAQMLSLMAKVNAYMTTVGASVY